MSAIKVSLASAALLLALSCTWTRFDDVLENSPAQVLETPGDTNALGLSVAAMRGKSSTLAFASAADAYAVYEFAKSDLVSNDALTVGSCSATDGCWSSTTVAAINQVVDSVATACFAFGVENEKAEGTRVLLACENNLVRGLPIPDPAMSELSALQPNSKAPRVQFASGPRLAPDLLAAANSASGSAWFYPVGAGAPLALSKPSTAGKSYGDAIAVAGTDATRFIAVGEPQGKTLHLMPTDGTVAPTTSLCISSPSTNFAVAITAGHFTSSDSVDLAVASDSEVLVLPGLDGLPYSADPTAPCVDIAAIDAARTISCTALNAGNACGGLLATVALAAADLDGDGRDELLIGTPSASTRGNDAAGKILVTSFGRTKPTLIQELSLSSAESGDRLGSSIAGVPLSRPEVVLAGAPGGNKLAAFFCTSLLPAGKGGARCD